MADLRAELLERIIALDPCYLRAEPGKLERLAKHWPHDVTPLWLLENAERGAHVVPLEDRLWGAWRLMPAEVTRPCARLAVLRACRVYAPAALDAAAAKLDATRASHTLREHSAILRALPDDVSSEDLERAARAAARAADAAALPAARAAVYAADYAAHASAADAADAAAAASVAADYAADATDAERSHQLADLIAHARPYYARGGEHD